MAFRGTFDHTLDAKNRLTVPAKFRAPLSDGVVLARGPEPCVEIWPRADYEQIHGAGLQARNPLVPEVRDLQRRLYASAFDTELDSAHRVMLPAKLAEHAGLDREVAVIGAGSCLEVWSRESWRRHDEDSPDRIRELSAGLEHPS